MKFKLQTTLVVTNVSDFYTNDDLFEKATIIKAYLKEGGYVLLTRCNSLFGVCDCCPLYSKDEFEKLEFYEEEI